MQWESDEEEAIGPETQNEAAIGSAAASNHRVKRFRFKTFSQRIAEVIAKTRDALIRLPMQILTFPFHTD